MKKLFIQSIILIFIGINICVSKDTNAIEIKSENPSKFLGLSASSISSIGISYHFLENKKNPTDAFKLTLGILPDLYSSSEIWIFCGAEFQTELSRNDFSRLYWLIGAGYQSLFFSVGSGVGYEIFTSKPGLAINLDLGLALLKGIPNPHGDAGSHWEIAPGVGLGLSYAY